MMPRLALVAVLFAAFSSACQTTPNREIGAPQGTNNKVAEINTQLGVGYLRAGKIELAWKRLHKAIEADPGYSAAQHAMALLYTSMKEPAKAEEHFQLAVKLDPTNSAAQNNYGSFLCQQRRYAEAEQRFLQAVKNPLYRDPGAAYTNAGLCMKSAGNLTKAEQYLRTALKRSPKLAPALIAMAEVSLANRQYLSARGYLERYLEIAPHTPRSLWLGVRIERALHDRDTAASYALLLRSKYPNSREAQALRQGSEQ